MFDFEWETAPEIAFGTLYDDYARRLYNQALGIAYRCAPEIENWMKANASWTDRTGNARQTLYAEVIPMLAEIVVRIGHGMDYGFWLETRFAGRYAILSPALDYWAPKILQDIRRFAS
jgi:hypothetical protein